MTEYLTRTDDFVSSLGLNACRVGGSVRDELLGRKVKDADYIVFQTPLDVLQNKVAQAGAKPSPLKLRDGRIVGVRANKPGLGLMEIVLPRKEVSTGPGHRDFEIVVDPGLSMSEDAERRDFTFNALYKSVASRNLFDPTGRGLDDLRRRRVNVTHADSFRDDPLRTLRALRFVSVLGYDLGTETRALMALHADAVTGLSAKGYASGTVLEELGKLLMGDNVAGALRLARDTGVLAVAFPELAEMLGFDQGSRYHDMTTDEHTFTALETAAHVGAPLRVRMALLFHDSGKPDSAWVGRDGRTHYYASPRSQLDPHGHLDDETWNFVKTEDHEVVGARLWRKAADRLGAQRRLKYDVETLILNHMVRTERVREAKVRRERARLGDEMLRDLYLMRMCDLSGKGDKNMKFLENIAQMERVRQAAQDAGVPCKVTDLEINGRDMHELGLKGAQIGIALESVLDEVIVQPDELRLSRDWQLSRAADIMKAVL